MKTETTKRPRKQRVVPYPNRICIKVSNVAYTQLERLSKSSGQTISVCLREALNDYLVNCTIPDDVGSNNYNQLDLFEA
jgi:hypothetical protein